MVHRGGQETAFLLARNVSKTYGGVHALSRTHLELQRGEVHALVGENGAGKSTFIKILSGAVRPDEGEIYLEGRPVRIDSPAHALHLGIRTVFQELTLIPDLSVAENLLLGREPGNRVLVYRRQALARAGEMLAEYGLDVDPREPVRRLPLSLRQQLEIVRALSFAPRLLILDEATSALAAHQVAWLFDLVRKAKDAGTAVLFTSHRWNEVKNISDRITVLRNGEHVATRNASELEEDEAVYLMTGRRLSVLFPERVASVRPEVALQAQDLWAGQLRGVSLELHRGEILGIGGLQGQGQLDLFFALFGVLPLSRGTVRVAGHPVRLRGPKDAIRAGMGIALVPEDRKTQGLLLPMSVQHNLTLGVLPSLSRFGVISARQEREWTSRMIHRLDIKAPSPGHPVAELSGGNQQKVVIGKWLLARSHILLLYDVTRGVDVATKHEIYELLMELASAGMAILFYSSDTEETAHLTHRALVLFEGAVVRELTGNALTTENLVRVSLQGEAVAG